MTEQNRCRGCGGSGLSRHFEAAGYGILGCTDCGFHQITPQPTLAELERIYAASYFGKAKYFDQMALDREYRRRLELIETTGLAPGAALLEVGCGVGDFLERLAPRFAASGMDISEDAIGMAKARLPQLASRLTASRIEDYACEAVSLDAIVLFDVVEHLWDPVGAMARLAGWLRPGGHLVLSTPNIGSPVARLMGRRWAFMTPPEHQSFFGPQSMRRALERIGFEVSTLESRGKWANAAFVVYKAARVGIVPQALSRAAQASPLARVSLYIPTADILYVVARKRR